MKSKIRFADNRPMIDIDGLLYPPLAYTTYFDECGQWSDFIRSGYRMFFVNVSFTDLPINNTTGFSPFLTGVFEKAEPDYSEFDKIVDSILAECDDAFIFPRINIAMPRRWIDENLYETVDTPKGKRESLFSDAFRNDGAVLLEKLVKHIRSSSYARSIAGYQLCAGATQEWFHHDLCGSYSEMGMEKFRKWAYDRYGVQNIRIPEKNDFQNGIVTDEVVKYYEFCSEEVVVTVEHFAKALKKIINDEQIVGVFYGYSAFVNDPLWGHQSLGSIINSPYIDFFSSPCAYDGGRSLGLDWGDMIPVDSVKLHGKLSFIECDIRTNLTKSMQSSRPGKYPENIYTLKDDKGNKTVWSGPATAELSLSAIRKAFSHQLVKASGIWWFDMWGGWYHSDEIMAEMENLRKIYEHFSGDGTEPLPTSEVALFIDEKAFRNIPRGDSLAHTASSLRVAMGNTGIPFDLYLSEDAEKVLHKYKLAIFSAPYLSDSTLSAKKICKELNIPYISADGDQHFYSTDELREILTSYGIHCYNKNNSVVYCAGNFLAVHTSGDGEIKINLPKKHNVRSLFGAEFSERETDTVVFTAKKHSTAAFLLS